MCPSNWLRRCTNGHRSSNDSSNWSAKLRSRTWPSSAAMSPSAGPQTGPCAPRRSVRAASLRALLRHCFPALNGLARRVAGSPRRNSVCIQGGTSGGRFLLTFLLRDGSRNAFDGDRNSGNYRRICSGSVRRSGRGAPGRTEDRDVFGECQTQASRVAVSALARLPLLMVRRLIADRLLDSAGYWGVGG